MVELEAYSTICRDIIPEILDTLVGWVLAFEEHRHRNPFNTSNLRYRRIVFGSLNLDRRTQIKDFHYAQLADLLCTNGGDPARVGTSENVTTSD